MDVTQIAAWLFALVIAGVVVFQVALALGAPWGAFAMGGAFPGRFPPRMRVAAIVQAIVLGALAVVVLSHAGLAVPGLAQVAPWLIWLAVGVSVVSLVLNAISPSAGERRIWVPVAIALTVTSLVVALTT
jgi:hypothetical protein